MGNPKPADVMTTSAGFRISSPTMRQAHDAYETVTWMISVYLTGCFHEVFLTTDAT
jgi:hypothetical protein